MSKMSLKMDLRIITKSHATDAEKGFLQNRFPSRIATQRPCRQPES